MRSCLILLILLLGACTGGREADAPAAARSEPEFDPRAVSAGDGSDAARLNRHFNQYAGDQ